MFAGLRSHAPLPPLIDKPGQPDRQSAAGGIGTLAAGFRMDWDDLRVFLALARGGSVRAAAAVLGVSASTVARRMDRLEKGVGSKLFDRLPAGFALTAIGETMLALAENVETDIFSLSGALRDATGRCPERSA